MLDLHSCTTYILPRNPNSDYPNPLRSVALRNLKRDADMLFDEFFVTNLETALFLNLFICESRARVVGPVHVTVSPSIE